MGIARVLGLCSALLICAPAVAGAVWTPVADAVVARLAEAQRLYREGEADPARREVVEAYFGDFESGNLEAAMRNRLGASYTYGVESRFAAIRKAIKRGAPLSKVSELIDDLSRMLQTDAALLDELGVPAELFEVDR